MGWFLTLNDKKKRVVTSISLFLLIIKFNRSYKKFIEHLEDKMETRSINNHKVYQVLIIWWMVPTYISLCLHEHIHLVGITVVKRNKPI
ncbi:hypothetical protein [Candidatus Hodgkinia cicadicola]|uniref:hypothetical protein n=1 Tax=Candidatus Hodgkinia cicadicola TaxID=573658 RepID=UPI002414EE73